MKRAFRKPSRIISAEQAFRSMGRFIERRHLVFLILSLVLLVPTVFAAYYGVEMKTGFDTFVSSDSQAYKDLSRYNEYFSSDAIVVLITGDNLIQLLEPENIAAMDFIEESMISDNSSHSVVGPVFLLEMAHLQRVLSGATTSMEFPTDPAELADIIKDPETGDVASELTHVFPDGQHALISILLDGSLTQDEQGDMVRKVEDLAASAGFNDDVSVIVSGNCAVYASIGDLMVEDMLNMLIVSVILMLLILALIFNVRGFFAWRWLPLGVVALAIIYTFGIMGILSIPLTMVTMAAFPILLGLGVDYAIQFHNRYDEESKKGSTVAGAITESVTHIGPAIGIAIVAGCLGFAALFFSPIPMIQGFGFTLILGVIICYILSVFLLLSALYRRDRLADTKPANNRRIKWTIKPKNKFTLGPELAAAVLTLSLVGFGIVFIACDISFGNLGFAVGIGITVFGILASAISLGIELHRERLGIALPQKTREKPRHIVDSGLDRLAPWVVKHPLIIIPIALALTVAGLVADPYIETEADEMNMISQETQVIKDLREVESVVEGLEFLSLLIEAEDVTDPQIVNWVLELQDRIEAENGDLVSGTESYASAMMQLVNVMNLSVPQTAEETKDTLQGLPTQLRANLLTEDYTRSNLMVTIGKISGPQVRDLETALNEYASQHPEGVTVTVTGWPIMMRILGDGLSGGRVEMTLIGIALIFVGLLLLFRFNILKVFMAILPVALIIGWSSGVMWLGDIKYTPATAAMGALIIGIGTEFTILLMMRYYEEREKGENPVEAMKIAITRIGRAIIASGLTVIGGFAALLIAQNFPVLRSFGLITVIDVFFALVSTLIVLPALIVWIDSWRERRRIARQGSP
ncbi:MAG: hydrophobe/amphiphile efflux-3 (HAE3) family transporter [Dehalococcoidia bacterium]